jgi:hypothetical protein
MSGDFTHDLTEISVSLDVLGNVAAEMRRETTLQGRIVDDLHAKTDGRAVHLGYVNRRIGRALDDADGGRLCVGAVLILIIFALIAYYVATM